MQPTRPTDELQSIPEGAAPGRVPNEGSRAVSMRAERFAWCAGGSAMTLVLASLLGPAVAQQDDNPQGQTQVLRPLPTTSSGVTGDSNNRMIAVTGNDITGQSVLYLVDTIDKQLAVYQASGGAPGTQSIKMVGARNISLDLQLDGFNDKTTVDGKSLTFKDLEKRFASGVDDAR